MKLLLVVMVLACRELVTEEWRALLTRLPRQWRDSVLQFGQSRKESPLVLLAIIAGLPALLLALLLLLAHDQFGGLWTWLLALLVLVPALVDRQLPSVLVHYRHQWLDAGDVDRPEVQLAQARGQLMASSLQELFTPLFWLLLLDTTGLVVVSVYYSLRLCAEQVISLTVAERARRLMAWLDWLPSRALALTFALAGQFVETWAYWRAHIGAYQVPAITFVDSAADKAERSDLALVATESLPLALMAALAAFESLCQRSVVIWVILLALHTLL